MRHSASMSLVLWQLNLEYPDIVHKKSLHNPIKFLAILYPKIISEPGGWGEY